MKRDNRWAQVNGWRGDTSIEKGRFDLYYIQELEPLVRSQILMLTSSRDSSTRRVLSGRSRPSYSKELVDLAENQSSGS
jgi:hypothetical protein